MASFYDITVGQQVEFMRVLASAGFTAEDVAHIIKKPGLASVMYASIQSAAQPIGWTPVDKYGAKLRDWNQQFKLGFTESQIDELVAKLPTHAGPLQPTSITLTLGKGLQHDWNTAMKIVQYELSQIGGAFTPYVDGSQLTYYAGCEVASDQRRLAPALLDLGRFWSKLDGVSVRQVRGQLRGQPLPTTEVAWLLALSPQVYAAMDGKTIPRLWAPGLVVDSECVPYFGRGADEAFVDAFWDGHQWRGSSVAAFRQC